MASNDDDDDILMDLLTYSCPQTGGLRTAGAAAGEPPKLLGHVAKCLKQIGRQVLAVGVSFHRTGKFTIAICEFY